MLRKKNKRGNSYKTRKLWEGEMRINIVSERRAEE